VFIILVALGARVGGVGVATGAEAQRTVHLVAALKREPVVITKVALGASTVQLGRWDRARDEQPDPDTPFTGNDDWLQNLTVYALNRTNQTIVFLNLQVDFPETTAGRTRAACQLNIGRIPAAAAFDYQGRPISQPPSAEPLDFEPGQTLAVHLADYVDKIRRSVALTLPLFVLREVNIRYVSADFAGGMRWGGVYQVFDPGTSAWKRLDLAYFPGNREGHWPGSPGWADPR
jgi:hypothetical protein